MMRRMLLCLALGAVLAVPGTALAQETVTVDGVEATRVVIAPPQTPVARLIKARIGAAYAAATPATRAYTDAQKLYYFYGARHFEPIWLSATPTGAEGFSPAAQKLIAVFKNAATEGFRPGDYLTPAIEIDAAGNDPAKLADLETAFSAATIRYARDAYMGRFAPETVSPIVDPETKSLDASGLLKQLASSDAPAKILAGLDPVDPEFLALKAALAKLDGTDGEPAPVVIPAGRTLKPGMADSRLPLLRERLKVTPPEASADTGAAVDVYDPELVAAVTDFQANAGLSADGIVGPATLAALNNVGSVSREDIIANMERWRWLPQDLGSFHVMVNIPEYRVAVVQNGQTTYSTRVVVGKPSTPTPLFSNAIRNIVVNPYWNVPTSIVAKEIAPHMLANPAYLSGQNMEIVSGNKVIDPYAIDWSSVTQSNWRYSIRQLPGRGNALGTVKFLFPNAHNVYLHDTPSKSLFGNAVRAYSHGCVRVQNPMEFANALLEEEPNLNAAKLEAMFGPAERWVNLKTHVPVHIAYFTVRPDATGKLRSYGDIYGLNKRLISLLEGTAKPQAPSATPIISGV